MRQKTGREMNNGWRGEKGARITEFEEWNTDLTFKGKKREAIECMNKVVRR